MSEVSLWPEKSPSRGKRAIVQLTHCLPSYRDVLKRNRSVICHEDVLWVAFYDLCLVCYFRHSKWKHTTLYNLLSVILFWHLLLGTYIQQAALGVIYTQLLINQTQFHHSVLHMAALYCWLYWSISLRNTHNTWSSRVFLKNIMSILASLITQRLMNRCLPPTIFP